MDPPCAPRWSPRWVKINNKFFLYDAVACNLSRTKADMSTRLTFGTRKDVVYMQTAYWPGNRPRKEAAQDTPSNGNFDLADRKLQRADCNYSRATSPRPSCTSATCVSTGGRSRRFLMRHSISQIVRVYRPVGQLLHTTTTTTTTKSI